MMDIYEIINNLIIIYGSYHFGDWCAKKILRWYKLRKGYLRELEIGEGKYIVTTSSAEETERVINEIVRSSEQTTKEVTE